jgi:hypothetical protein
LEVIGGKATGGRPFDASLSIASGETKMLKIIRIRAGNLIDALQFWWLNNYGAYTQSAQFGGNGEIEYYIYLNEGEYISWMQFLHGQYVDRIIFYTSQNRIFTYGGTGRNSNIQNATWDPRPLGKEFHGFAGRSGSLIDQLVGYAY